MAAGRPFVGNTSHHTPSMQRLLFSLFIWCAATMLPAQVTTDVATVTALEKADTIAAQAARADSVVVSLLTVSPGPRIYELYGHTALRVREVLPGRFSDWVFNYGTFSFDQPNFVWRFLRGETNYELGIVPYSLFYDTYVREGRGLTELRLNLTPDETRRPVNRLSTNLLPENATYRYDFFYDNCVTRAIDVVAKSIDGRIDWGREPEPCTLRQIIHHYSAASPWDELGQDLLLGAEADKMVGRATQEFAPLYAESFVGQATIVAPDGSRRPLALPAITLLPATRPAETAAWYSPLVVFGGLLLLVVGASVAERRKRTHYYALDALLLLGQGIVGLFVSFLFFFSDHPAVDSNWLIVLFNPLPLILVPWLLKDSSLGRRSWTYKVEALLLAASVCVFVVGPQYVPAAVWLYTLTLAVRTAVGLRCHHTDNRPAAAQ